MLRTVTMTFGNVQFAEASVVRGDIGKLFSQAEEVGYTSLGSTGSSSTEETEVPPGSGLTGETEVPPGSSLTKETEEAGATLP